MIKLVVSKIRRDINALPRDTLGLLKYLANLFMAIISAALALVVAMAVMAGIAWFVAPAVYLVYMSAFVLFGAPEVTYSMVAALIWCVLCGISVLRYAIKREE